MTTGTTGWLAGRVYPGTNLDVRWAAVPRLGPERNHVHESVRALRRSIVAAEQIRTDRSWRLWSIALLNVADLVTTFMVLLAGGREANPVMGSMLGSWWAPTVVKAAIFGLVWMATVNCPVRSNRVDRVLQVAVVFFGVVVAWNLAVLIQVLPSTR